MVACVLAACAAATAHAGVVAIGCPATPPLPATTFVGEVTIDTGMQALGAYTLAITYDPAVVVVASIAGGTTAEFSSPPIVNPADFPTGRTRLLAFNSVSLTSPTGAVSVARITFNVIGLPGSSTSLGIEITTLADTNGSRITADTMGCSVVVATTMTPGASPTQTVRLPTVTPSATPTATVLTTLVPTAERYAHASCANLRSCDADTATDAHPHSGGACSLRWRLQWRRDGDHR